MAIETELKLRIAPAHLLRLKRHPFLRSLANGKASSRKLHSIYFDTPELHLHRREMALRLRHVGKQWIQTLKGGGAVHAGLHQRNEWESIVTGQQLDIEALEAQGATHLPPDLINHLQPLFVTEFTRSIYMVNFEGALIELSVDSGEIRAGKLRHQISEVELELKSGKPLQLFHLALALLDIVPLEIESTSKAEYGFRLLHPIAFTVAKAGMPVLEVTTPVSTALQEMVWSCLLHLQANVAGVLNKADEEYLHQVRVALRRLRVVLKMVARFHTDTELDVLRNAVSVLGTELGAAREWDVFVTQTLPTLVQSLELAGGAKKLMLKSEKQRQQHHQQVDVALKEGQLQRLILLVGAWMNGRYWLKHNVQQKLEKFSCKVLTQYKSNVMQFSGHVHSYADANLLHELRIACKNLRYSIELYASLYATKKTQRYLKSLTKLQDALGKMNDHAVAMRLLSEAGQGQQQKLLLRMSRKIEHGHAKRINKLRKNWKQFAKLPDFWC